MAMDAHMFKAQQNAIADLKLRLRLAETRLRVLSNHADGIHDGAACFRIPRGFAYRGSAGAAIQLADAWRKAAK